MSDKIWYKTNVWRYTDEACEFKIEAEVYGEYVLLKMKGEYYDNPHFNKYELLQFIDMLKAVVESMVVDD